MLTYFRAVVLALAIAGGGLSFLGLAPGRTSAADQPSVNAQADYEGDVYYVVVYTRNGSDYMTDYCGCGNDGYVRALRVSQDLRWQGYDASIEFSTDLDCN